MSFTGGVPISTTSALSRATSVPDPIATPTDACFNAGASLIPSPTMATLWPFDLAIGDDNLFRGDRYKRSLRLTALNIGNKDAVYNLLSTFSGTHYVTPRALSAEVGFHF